MEQRLSQRQFQTQKLAMTQSLRQSLEILNFSTYELDSFLRDKQQENPWLKIRSKGPTLISPEMVLQIPDQTSYKDILYSQLIDFQLTDELTQLVKWLLDDLNEDGFLIDSLAEYGKWTNKPESLIKEAIDIIQQFEPIGIGAFSKQHALILQATYHEMSKQTIDIVKNHFDLLINRKWKELAKKMHISLEEIQQVADTLSEFSTSPLQLITEHKAAYIQPDACVLVEEEELNIIFYGHAFPKVHIDKSYMKTLPSQIDADVMTYMKQKSKEISNIDGQLQWRKSTLQRIIQEIVHRQQNYFIHGTQFLVPMTMTDVAELLELHESTVSRAVREKYLQTQTGVVSLKSFFSQPSTEDVSATHVKARIQSFIDHEEKDKPLSDQKIVDMLTKERIHLSRRVITKYRKQLLIVSSSKRKRFERKDS
ncbi:RNA polymerase factor sigma-54 [Paenisporosarcina sp. TG-14]|uniref:RNA polymerase factor sigma-54 n=1 Tax=Paenisporosarcina sp. TG-14 TaxID=1231057 RepID=UPI0002E789E7|nr:RNA polymerase factor sigma-54 [Paenisporosarcina sp. TG-14]